MALLSVIKNAVFRKLNTAPGLSQQVSLESLGKATDDAETFHPAGFYSKIIDSTNDSIIGVIVDAGDNNILVASHNYDFEKDVDKGEALIYSIDENGNILSSALVGKDGKFVVNDGTRDAARKDDAVASTSVEDATFWTWVNAVSAALNTLGIPVTPVPTSLTGKITEGTDEVKLP